MESETAQDDFLKGVTVKLTQEEKEKLDEDFTQDELKASMNDLNKTEALEVMVLLRNFMIFGMLCSLSIWTV